MTNIYDIVLNLLDSKRVYEAFEWNGKDNIEHIKKIPLFKITSTMLDQFIKHIVVVDESLLKSIYQKTELYSGEKKTVIDYACLFTDSYKVLGAEFNKEGRMLFKSFLLLDEEEEIIDISEQLEIKKINYKIVKKQKGESYLTREEEFRKNYLIREIKYAYQKEKYEKINYLFEEIYPKKEIEVKEKYRILINDIEKNYSMKHNSLFKILKLVQKSKNKKYEVSKKSNSLQ